MSKVRLRQTTRRALHGAVAVLGLSLLAMPAAGGPRQKISLNDNWSFALEPDGGEGLARWQAIDLPHTWNAGDSADKARPYRRGAGHYRKKLFLAEALRGARLWLYFEGANQVADVAVNGQRAGGHVGGYTAFAVDISERVRYGGQNDIEVRVDNRHDDDIPPLDADFTFYGGIYRDAWLLVLDDVHFFLDEFAATDLRLHVQSVSDEAATIGIDAGIANESARARNVQVDTELRTADGQVLARNAVVAPLAAGSVSRQSLARFDIDKPQLWSPESPYLYRVICTIRDGDAILDRLEYPLGLRWFGVDASEGFRLNGHPYRLFGTNRHQDYPGLGNALPDARHRADLQAIKDNGFNFVRLAHYPQDPAVLDAADQLGLIVWEEIPVVNTISTTPAFRDNSTRMLREMIRQHRHHPSVAFWGYMNEVLLRLPDPLPANYNDAVVALARHLNDAALHEDPSRPTVMAQSRDEVDKGVPLGDIPDVLAHNLYFGWYYEKFATLGEFLDRYHAAHPDTPLIVSEYGAGSDRRVHSLAAEAFDFSTEYQQQYHEASFRQILARPWLTGSAVWNQFDFGSNHRQDTINAVNQKGLWTFDRQPKDIAWYYRARLRAEPVLHVAARDWTRRAGSRSSDVTMPVRVYSNAAAVTLFVNGESQGEKNVQDAAASWDVRFTQGDNELTARANGLEDAVTVHYDDRSGLFRDAMQTDAVLAVNAGASEQYVDADGPVWEADRAYRKGSWGYLGGDAVRSHRRILDTDDDPLYQTARRGAHTYRFDVPNGAYLLTLHFAKLDESGTPADRVHAEVNGLAVDVGDLVPYTRRAVQALVTATGSKGIELEFADDNAAPFVNGIVLEPVAGH